MSAGSTSTHAAHAGAPPAEPVPRDVALITLTRDGMAVAAELAEVLDGTVTVYVSEKYDAEAPSDWRRFPRRLQPLVDELWARHEALIFVMAAGIVVRAIAPHVRSKLHDPGVIVVDIRGRYAVALCSGHLGGANALCRVIGERTATVPVITTGTDVTGALAPDVLARRLGARVEDWSPLKLVSGALVDRRPVGVYVEPGVAAGSPAWFAERGATAVDDPAELGRFEAAFAVTHRLLPEPGVPTLWIRPPVLAVGVGCNRGTGAAEIAAEVDGALRDAGLSPAAAARVATFEKKADEAGLLAFAAERGLPLWWYDAEAIAAAPPYPNPSEVVYRYVGVRGVAEPAALLAAGARELLVEKQRRGNVTVAVARIAGEPRPPTGEARP